MNEKEKLATTTQVRNLYSDGISYMNIKFYNTNLSISLYQCLGKNEQGRSFYDKAGEFISLSFEGAYALYNAAIGILDGRIKKLNLIISGPANSQAELKYDGNTADEKCIFTIARQQNTVPFEFKTHAAIVNDTKYIIQSGLGAFAKTIEGYLTGINSERHLNKMTDEYIKSLQQVPNQIVVDSNHSAQQNQNNGQYNNKQYNGNNKTQYNNHYNGRKNNYRNNNRQYSNNQYNNNNNQNWDSKPNQQGFDSYQIQ